MHVVRTGSRSLPSTLLWGIVGLTFITACDRADRAEVTSIADTSDSDMAAKDDEPSVPSPLKSDAGARAPAQPTGADAGRSEVPPLLDGGPPLEGGRDLPRDTARDARTPEQDGAASPADSGMPRGAADAARPGGSQLHLFLLLGQSNMAGYPKANDADRVQDPRIKVLGYDDCQSTGRKENKWAVASPPLHECWNGAIGPADYFSKTLLKDLSEADSIGLIPCAISGEKIETFLKRGGAKYSWILSRARLAQQDGGVIDGILFHQGESNNGDPSWPGKVQALVADLRADLALGDDVPFLAGELPYDGACAGHNQLVNMLPATIPNAHVVSAQSLKLDPADTRYRLHFGHDAQVELGKRYAAKFIQASPPR